MANNTTSDTAQEDHTLATTVALETVCLTKEAVRNRWGYLLIGLLITACLLLNGLVLGLIIRSRSLHRTIFYLLGSLAVADILHAILVMTPQLAFTLLDGCWLPGLALCLGQQGMEGMLTAASLAHLCMAVCDCHTALLRPLQYQLRQVGIYSSLHLFFTWFLALLLATPFLVVLIVVQGGCGLERPEHTLTWLGGCLVLPAALLLGLYTCASQAVMKQKAVISQMKHEAHSTSNGDVTGLDCIEHDIVSEKTITQTIDICCQLAGVGPISQGGPTQGEESVTSEVESETQEEPAAKEAGPANGHAPKPLDGDDAEIVNEESNSNAIQCVAQVHVSNNEEPLEVDIPITHVEERRGSLLVPVETAMEPVDALHGLGKVANDSKLEETKVPLERKKSKESLNAPVEVTEVDVDCNGFDNHAFEVDETPLATSIRAVHEEEAEQEAEGEESEKKAVPNGKPASYPPTREPSQHRSILRRDNSHRNTVPKSVKFASTVSTKQIGGGAIHRVPTGRRRPRNGSLRNPHRLTRQTAISEDTLLAGLQMSGQKMAEYLAQLHQRQSQRVTLRVKRQMSVLRLVTLMSITFLVMVAPSALLQVSLSLCTTCSVSEATYLGLLWLKHAAHVVNPIIYFMVTTDFKAALRQSCDKS